TNRSFAKDWQTTLPSKRCRSAARPTAECQPAPGPPPSQLHWQPCWMATTRMVARPGVIALCHQRRRRRGGNAPRPRGCPVNSAFYDAGCHGRLRRRRALAGLLVFVLCVLVMAAVVIVVVVASGQAERVLSTAPGALAPVYFGLVSVPVIIAPGALLAGRVGLRQSPAELVSNRRRFRPRLQLAAAAV